MSCILDFLLYDVTQREINNNNGGLRVQLPTLPISKSISSNRVDDDLF